MSLNCRNFNYIKYEASTSIAEKLTVLNLKQCNDRNLLSIVQYYKARREYTSCTLSFSIEKDAHWSAFSMNFDFICK